MQLINQAHNTMKFIKSQHREAPMDCQQKKQAIASFSKRMTDLIGKTEAAFKKARNDDFTSIDFELIRLKADFQKMSAECEPQDPTVFQFGQMLQKFETTFEKINPLRFV